MIKGGFNQKCLACNHLGFCKTYWGEECKRQGGNRLPRLKSSPNKQSPPSRKDKALRPKRLQQSKLNKFQNISTRVVEWNL